MKNLLFVLALLSLAMAAGCAKGGNGIVPPPITIDVEPAAGVSSGAIYPTQTVTITATVSPAGTPPAVTWSLNGAGTLTPVTPATVPATATYVAPATAGAQPVITATLVSDTTKTGTRQLTIADITTQVSPGTLTIGNGLTQQFTTTALPDDAPQTFTWTCTASGVTCKNFHQDANISGLAYYTAQDTCGGNCIQISAASTLDPNGCAPNPKNCSIAKASLATSRVSGTYAFQFSGYDNGNNADALVGTFTANANGQITSGVAEELTISGWAQHTISGGSYTPTGTDANNSNNAGTLTLNTGVSPNKYQVAINSNGDLFMLEGDGNGKGSGMAHESASQSAFTGNQTFAFGFTGVDPAGKRVGAVGVLPMQPTAAGTGNIVSGQMDVNYNGATNSICPSPCSLSGTYAPNGNGGWTMTIAAGTANLTFDFFISTGTTSKTNPLTFYAISKSAALPVSGTMVLQDNSQTYNIAAFKGTSITGLTGVNGGNTNVALIYGTTDGNGNFSGQFDQNNAGSIISAAAFPPTGSTKYTYAAGGTTNGRYTFNLLGNPTANPVVDPIPFVLYASGANRGFLLDQNSMSVMTGAMNLQGKNSGAFGDSEMPGTYAAATTGSGSAAVDPLAANLILTEETTANGLTFNVLGTQYLPQQTVAGTYGLSGTFGNGIGNVTLTAPAAQKFALYAQDTSGCSGSSTVCFITDFLMFDNDSSNKNPSLIFAQQ